jgi:hypothetical protein
MLSDAIRGFARDSGNQLLGSCATAAPSTPTWARDPAHNARLQFDALQLKSTLGLFEQAKRETEVGFYRECVEINLVYQKWREALSLALKSGKADAIFLSAVAAGEFDLAAEQLRPIRAQLVSRSTTSSSTCRSRPGRPPMSLRPSTRFRARGRSTSRTSGTSRRTLPAGTSACSGRS